VQSRTEDHLVALLYFACYAYVTYCVGPLNGTPLAVRNASLGDGRELVRAIWLGVNLAESGAPTVALAPYVRGAVLLNEFGVTVLL